MGNFHFVWKCHFQVAHEKSHSDPALLTGKYLSPQNFHINPSLVSVGLDTGSRVGRQEGGSQEAQGAPAEPQQTPLRSLPAPPASFRGKVQLFPTHSQQKLNIFSNLFAPFFQYMQPMPASLPKTCSTPSFISVSEQGGSCPTHISQSIRQSYSSALSLDTYKAITIPRMHIHHQAFKLQKAPKKLFSTHHAACQALFFHSAFLHPSKGVSASSELDKINRWQPERC